MRLVASCAELRYAVLAVAYCSVGLAVPYRGRYAAVQQLALLYACAYVGCHAADTVGRVGACQFLKCLECLFLAAAVELCHCVNEHEACAVAALWVFLGAVYVACNYRVILLLGVVGICLHIYRILLVLACSCALKEVGLLYAAGDCAVGVAGNQQVLVMLGLFTLLPARAGKEQLVVCVGKSLEFGVFVDNTLKV